MSWICHDTWTFLMRCILPVTTPGSSVLLPSGSSVPLRTPTKKRALSEPLPRLRERLCLLSLLWATMMDRLLPRQVFAHHAFVTQNLVTLASTLLKIIFTDKRNTNESQSSQSSKSRLGHTTDPHQPGRHTDSQS